MSNCPYCNRIHDSVCSLVKAFEYFENGTLKRVEFHSPQPLVTATMNPNVAVPAIPNFQVHNF